MNQRIIYTIDVDAFFAQAEEKRHPEFKNYPIGIGYNLNNRGIITTSNYPARRYGIYSGQPIFKALKLFSKLKIIEPEYEYYSDLSEEIFKIIANYTNNMEVASIDECFIDVTNKTTKANAQSYAKKIQDQIFKTLNLTVSIGISSNKILSKIASKFNKPFGISTLFEEEIQEKLWPLSVIEMYGIGLRTMKKLQDLNIITIGQLANLKKEDYKYPYLQNQIGINIDYLIAYANGKDNSTLKNTYHYVKSLSHAETYPYMINNHQEMIDKLFVLTKILVKKIKYRNLLAQTVVLQLKDKKQKDNLTEGMNLQFKKYNFLQQKLNYPNNDLEIIFFTIMTLFDKWYKEGEEINYLGVGARDFIEKFHYGQQQYLDQIKEEKPDENSKIKNLIIYLNQASGKENFATGEDYQKIKRFKDKKYSKNDTIKFKRWE